MPAVSTYVLNQCSLVLEGVTFAQVVKLVVKVLIDLAAGTVLDEKTTEDSETAHPNNLAVDSSIYDFHGFFSRITYLGIRASAVPFLLPKPRCLPIRRAAVSSRARDRECMVTGFRMMRPSATSFRMVWRELALEISLVSLGSSQILRFPQPTTDAARRFWVVRLTLS
jgi:hypothetical protein